MGVQFSESDNKKLQELLEKQRRAKRDARNEQKRNDRMCEKLFGMKQSEVQSILDERNKASYSWGNEYFELKAKVERLCAVIGSTFEDFESYVSMREEKSRIQARIYQN